MAKLKNDAFNQLARYLEGRRQTEDEQPEEIEYENIYDEDEDEPHRYEPCEYDPEQYRHSNSNDSQCTTCSRRDYCDIFGEMCSMNDKGIVMIMLKCKYYDKFNSSHNQRFDGVV
jgi:hypothetical protein